MLDTPKLYELGGELGLNITELIRIPTQHLPVQLCIRWLREDDDVHQTSGTPTWSSLVRAVRSIGANGLANRIELERKWLVKPVFARAMEWHSFPATLKVEYRQKFISCFL